MYIKKIFYVYLFLKERKTQCEWGRGREREGDTIQSRVQAPSCQHRAWLRARTHKPWDHDLSWGQMPNRLSHPGAPGYVYFKSLFILRERASMHVEERGRERVRERIPSRICNVSEEPNYVRSWPELKLRVRHFTDWATQAPWFPFF